MYLEYCDRLKEEISVTLTHRHTFEQKFVEKCNKNKNIERFFQIPKHSWFWAFQGNVKRKYSIQLKNYDDIVATCLSFISHSFWFWLKCHWIIITFRFHHNSRFTVCIWKWKKWRNIYRVVATGKKKKLLFPVNHLSLLKCASFTIVWMQRQCWNNNDEYNCWVTFFFSLTRIHYNVSKTQFIPYNRLRVCICYSKFPHTFESINFSWKIASNDLLFNI